MITIFITTIIATFALGLFIGAALAGGARTDLEHQNRHLKKILEATIDEYEQHDYILVETRLQARQIVENQ